MATTSPAWTQLQSLAESVQDTNIASLVNHPARLDRFTLSLEGFYVDFSKHLVTDDVFDALIRLANDCGLKDHIDQLMSGATVNVSEGRAALHTGLRDPGQELPDEFAEHVLAERNTCDTQTFRLRHQ